MADDTPSALRRIISDFDFDPADRDRLRESVGATRCVLVSDREALTAALREHPDSDVLCSFRPPADLVRDLPALRWIALPSAGADHAVRAGLVRVDGPVVTTAAGIHAIPIGEFVLSAMLVWARNWPQMERLQAARAWPDHRGWEELTGRELYGQTLGVVGLGAIGQRVAQLGRALGMRVVGLRRHPNKHDGDTAAETVLGPERLGDLLSQSDVVVLALPSTPETHHLINGESLAFMRPSGLLVNISRGDLVNEADLYHALQAGMLAGAALDVFEVEPLPVTSPLWTLPNVIVSPHVAGSTPAYSRRFTDLLLENIRRYQAGETLLNIVDPVSGY